MKADGDAGRHGDVHEMSGGELDELFGFAEDPEFLQVCERGRVAFSEAVVENSVRRSVEMVRRDRVDQSERSAPARQRRPRVRSGVRLAVPDYVEVLMNRGARVTGTRRAKLVVLRGPQPSRGKHPRRHRGDLLSERLPRTLRRAAPPATLGPLHRDLPAATGGCRETWQSL